MKTISHARIYALKMKMKFSFHINALRFQGICYYIYNGKCIFSSFPVTFEVCTDKPNNKIN